MLLRSPVTQLGAYDLHGQLAAGGMASVHLATRRDDPETLVALKLVHDHLDEDEFLKRFIQEAKICQRIEHPNVCRVLDLGEERGLHYLVMEFLHGGTLAAVMRALRKRGGWTEDDLPIAISCLVDVLDGLHAAHELEGDSGEHLDVVHRDLSPSNVFVTFGGHTKVLDFGIAKARNALHKSVTGELRGTIAYMSPEQASALPVDRRADVWSVGVILWELLAMQRLFRRDNDVATLKAVLQEQPEAPSKSNPDCPPVFDEVCLSALKRSVGQRPSNAKRFADQLRNGLKLMRWDSPSTAARARFVRGLLTSELEKGEARLDEVAAVAPRTKAFITATTTTPVSTSELDDMSTVEVSDEIDDSTATDAPMEQSARPSEFDLPPEQPVAPMAPQLRLLMIALPIAAVAGLAYWAVADIEPVRQSIPLPAAGPLHPAAHGPAKARPEPASAAVAPETETERAVTGALTSDDDRLLNGSPADSHRFEWESARRVRIEIESDQFDSVLILRSPTGLRIESDDMAKELGPARSWNAGGVFEIDEPGTWVALVSSAYEQERGHYTLRVEEL